MIELVPLATIAPDAVESLLDRAFGADRHLRTAYRIRAGVAPIAELSFAAVADGRLIGTIQCWPVELAGDTGERLALVMVGPVAVDPVHQGGGVGQQLTARALAEADARRPDEPTMLIGDPEYYGRFFGFSDAATRGWRAPGPVEQRRLLARGALPLVTGTLGPRTRAAAA